METRVHLRASLVAAAIGVAAFVGVAWGQEPRADPWPTPAQPAWPSSRFHGALNGDGATIPCRCRFGGQSFRLGETVCMSTPNGDMLARCDLMLNNTSWVPTGTACAISLGPARSPTAVVAIAASGLASHDAVRDR